MHNCIQSYNLDSIMPQYIVHHISGLRDISLSSPCKLQTKERKQKVSSIHKILLVRARTSILYAQNKYL